MDLNTDLVHPVLKEDIKDIYKKLNPENYTIIN
jgi:hypothetical protein